MEWVNVSFNVYSMTDKTQKNESAFVYILSFVSEEMFVNKFTNISRSFNGVEISKMVDSVLSDVTHKDKFVTKTAGKLNYI